MPDANLPPVLVLGSHLTALGALRALGRAGIPTYRVGVHGDFVARSRWHRPLPGPDESPDPAPLAEWLETLPFERAVVLPCSDTWSVAVAGLPERLRERFPTGVAPPEALAQLVDKAAFAQALRRLDVPHPLTILVGDGEEPPDPAEGQLFVKPANSQAFFARYGVKAFAVSSAAEASERIAAAQRDGLEVVVQEYVPGPPGAHHFLDGYVDRRGRLLALMARRRLRMYPLDFGNSTSNVSIPLEELSPAVEDVTRLLEGIGYRGIFSVELKRDPRDGVLRVIEVNARPWWYVEFASVCGVDVCTLAYHDALGHEVAAVDGYEVGRRCFYPSSDFGAFLGLWRRGELGPREWLRSVWRADTTVFARDDPLPGFAHAADLVLRRARALAGTGRR